MDFAKYKHRKWESLGEEEKNEWDVIVNSRKDGLMKWAIMIETSEKQKCLAGEKLGYSWIKKLPYDVMTPFLSRLEPKFIFHMKSTHGIEPETLESVLKN